MSEDFSYDPVTAVDEATATGATAKIFADIRETMGLPILTSIWRGLASMDDSLGAVWSAAKPIYLSGHPETALARVVEQSDLPVPELLPPTLLACAGIDISQLEAIRTIVDAYNRSNGMNLVALAAVVSPQADAREEACPVTTPKWGAFPALMARDAIDDDTWELIRHVNAFGAPSIDAHVATLWRHLGHWPNLLALIYCAFAPLHADGSISAATDRMIKLTRQEGARMAHWRNEDVVLSEQARNTLIGYVSTPTQVARMVTIGHAIARWLPRR
ncbi:MAG: hypothetical protein JSU95_15235 [Betaproteobacteria bacterium]|nr:MAG: hypothetical protein JSU95_15235 [Betaproteobacteria bacterium]